MIYSLRVITAWLECFLGKPSCCWIEHGGKVKRIEWSNGLDTSLLYDIIIYKTQLSMYLRIFGK